MEHPKTVTKLLKPAKQPNVITQQLNRMKDYTESETADRTLQLDLIKRHIFTKKCPQ